MDWTTEKPTIPGIYWVSEVPNRWDDGKPYAYELLINGDWLMLGDEESVRHGEGALYMGPIAWPDNPRQERRE